MFILRVDDRLVHGQVIAGWARPLAIDLLIIASDKISQDEWTCNAYRLAVPEGMKFLCFDIKTCAHYLGSEADKKRTMVVVEKVVDACALVDSGVQVKEINIGGLSFTDGARALAPYINLSLEDIQAAVKLYERGVKLIGRQLPNSPPIDIMVKLAGVKTA
jgi:mannose/fructose/N-acetylgalactosamine-specific phosphotransferase system component IIB